MLTTTAPLQQHHVNKFVANSFLYKVIQKEIAARISQTELAIDNYDLEALQFATYSLRGIFNNLKMSEVAQYIHSIEYAAFNGHVDETKEMLSCLKKFLSDIVRLSED